MTTRKERLTVTVDPKLIVAGNQAVASGRAESLSGWVNLALAERASKEQQLLAMADAVATYEKKHGAISTREIADQQRADHAAATIVRGGRRAAVMKRRRRGAA